MAVDCRIRRAGSLVDIAPPVRQSQYPESLHPAKEESYLGWPDDYAGAVFISATGLTWSKWAGSNIAQWRHSIGWVTPSVSLKLDENTFSEIAPAATPKTPHADHQLTGDSALPAHPGMLYLMAC